ncbi:MAG: tRNA (adenosine(37)-N6)-threonylcarbamoyltransferase complex dimerization subunit type 1 TsaB [Actinomycetota bacterium]|nr:tRNA (adenosine(37)-N6)-threonylcarbamoyltransferase complex dimerization subunit type 1 TsaB [Actinomycetota bacterium]
MKILAIDSTSKKLSVCISEDNETLSTVNDNKSLKHMVNIISDIDKAFMELKFNIHDIDLFAVNLGPGDFTGSRIGISVIKTFSMLSGKEAFGFNALDVFTVSSLFKNIDKIEKKISIGEKVIIIPLMDVRNHEIFFSIFEVSIVDNKHPGKSIKDIFKNAQSQDVVFISGINDKKILVKKLYDENVLIKKDEFADRFFKLLIQIKKLNECTCSSCGSLFAKKVQSNYPGSSSIIPENPARTKETINYILTGNAFSSYGSIFEEVKNNSKQLKKTKIFIEKNNKYTEARYINLLAYFRAITDSGNKNIAPFYVRDFIPFGKRI